MRQLCPRHQSISQPDRNPAGHAWAGTVDIDRPRRPRRRSAPPATQSTRYHRTSQRLRLLVWAAALVGTAAGCQASPAQQDANPSATSPITAPATGHGRSGSAATEAALVGAGDIALCRGSHDEATADLLDHIPGAVFTAGDNAYEDGSTKDYGNCFQPSWGRHRDRIRPAPGNHEYHTAGARAYFTYFGAAAGDPTKGYYSYNLGAWHIVVLNSNCDSIGGCGSDSAQVRWLRDDLSASPTRCTLAYWHHAYYTSGEHHKPATWMHPLVETLYNGGADVIVAAHNHNYERFAPQTPDAVRDDARGIRGFVVGTGGAILNGFGNPKPNSEVRNADTYGVIRFTLNPQTYDWEFVPEKGQIFRDSGSGTCH